MFRQVLSRFSSSSLSSKTVACLFLTSSVAVTTLNFATNGSKQPHNNRSTIFFKSKPHKIFLKAPGVPLSVYTLIPRALCHESGSADNGVDNEADRIVEIKEAEAKKPVVTIEIPDVADDSEWEQDKQKCSFCRSFLQSPCKEQFKKWSKCVDKAKELDADFIESCSVYTRALMNCTQENEKYFEEINRAATEEDEADAEAEEGNEDQGKETNDTRVSPGSVDPILEEDKVIQKK